MIFKITRKCPNEIYYVECNGESDINNLHKNFYLFTMEVVEKPKRNLLILSIREFQELLIDEYAKEYNFGSKSLFKKYKYKVDTSSIEN